MTQVATRSATQIYPPFFCLFVCFALKKNSKDTDKRSGDYFLFKIRFIQILTLSMLVCIFTFPLKVFLRISDLCENNKVLFMFENNWISLTEP